MAFCGEKYIHKIRGAEDTTPADPCFLYCDEDDWEGWRQSMEAFQAELNRKSGDLLTKATNMGRADVAERVNQLYVAPAHNAVTAAQAASPNFFNSWPGQSGIHAAIQKAIEAMNLMACALEQIDLAYAEIGLAPPETPGAVGAAVKPKDDTDWWAWAKKAGIAVGVGTFSYLIIRYWLASRLVSQQAATAAPPRGSPGPPPRGSRSRGGFRGRGRAA